LSTNYSHCCIDFAFSIFSSKSAFMLSTLFLSP
jgi:hypothetical protein